MPRANRNTETESYKPLINFEKTAYEKLSLKLSEPVVTNLRAYVAYVESSIGVTPSVDEIVDKGMQRLFDADKGFRNWLHQQNGVAADTENTAAKSVLPAARQAEPAKATFSHAGD